MEAIQEILSRAGIFQGVDPVAVGNLIQELETVRFPRGATIFEEGEPGDRLYIITSGKVKLARHAPDGRDARSHDGRNRDHPGWTPLAHAL